MVNVLDCGIDLSEFELQSRYYILFWTNTLEKGMKLLIPQLWIKSYHCFSYTRMVLVLNNLFAIKQGN